MSHFVLESKAHNKQFKRDSQRMVFSLCVGFSVLGGMRRHWYCVAHPLTGRYVLF
ncbi:DUF3265 domain-containing protein [Vibrio qinghaiensis]|uniref:DUF3265 domain-containing protein n=1 Tax=Vibrio qinghaiensis TaxID=2025808 RepID=A0A223N3U3_9VIBR|nr:DUF3265 domain-containing protein [Vibrio qinghaiensis]